MYKINPTDRVICVTHNDSDGIFSGFVVKHFIPRAVVYQTGYGKPFDNNWLDCDVLFVTDFSFDGLETLKKIEDRKDIKLIWIDHHEIIKEAEKAGFNPEGLRRQDVSAAYLTWEYFSPDSGVPLVIELISDYDTWKWKTNDNEGAYLFQNSVRMMGLSATNEKDKSLFERLLIDDDFVENRLLDSKIIEESYKDIIRYGACYRDVFLTKFEGFDALACNIGSFNSTLFEPYENYCKDHGINLRILFNYSGTLSKFRVSVFSTDPENLSAHELCRRYGGGGHKGAGGFICEASRIPFDIKNNISKVDMSPTEITESVLENPKYHVLLPLGVTQYDVLDYYAKLESNMDEPLIGDFASKNEHIPIYSNGFDSTINGLKAICVNDPAGTPTAFFKTLKNFDHDIGVYFNLMNNGKWLYRVYNLKRGDNVDLLAQSFPTCKVLGPLNTSYLMFISDTMPETDQPF